jgi:IclR family pca regulon transcriptional regulator
MVQINSQNDRYVSTALVRGLEILKLFNTDTPRLTLIEIAEEMGVNRTVPYRLVYTLEKTGYLQQDKKTKQYSLTPKVLELGFAYLKSLQLPEIAQPYLQQLRDKLGFSVHLGILDDKEVVYVARAGANDSRPTSLNVTIGSRLPVHATSLGKVLLAYQSKEVIEEKLYGSELEAYTNFTKTSLHDLQHELKEIKERGYALSREEFEIGMRSIAVPIFGRNRKVMAAINIAASASVIREDSLENEVLNELKTVAHQLSAYYGNVT